MFEIFVASISLSVRWPKKRAPSILNDSALEKEFQENVQYENGAERVVARLKVTLKGNKFEGKRLRLKNNQQ